MLNSIGTNNARRRRPHLTSGQADPCRCSARHADVEIQKFTEGFVAVYSGGGSHEQVSRQI